MNFIFLLKIFASRIYYKNLVNAVDSEDLRKKEKKNGLKCQITDFILKRRKTS